MELKFNIKNQTLTRIDKHIIVNKSHDYLTLKFKFLTDDWNGLTKYVILKDENNAYQFSIGMNNIGYLDVPGFVLEGNFFKVSLYAGNRITTNEKTVVLIPAGYTTNISPVTDDDVKDVFATLTEALADKINSITYEEGYLKCWSDNKLLYSIELVDNELSCYSEHAVSNSVITSALGSKADTVHSHTSSDVTDLSNAVDSDLDRLFEVLNEKVRQI